jgi:hypothetical protein
MRQAAVRQRGVVVVVKARPDSDLDLLAVLPRVEDKRRAAVEIMRTVNGLPVRKDIVRHMLRPALREGKVLYEHART